MAFSTAFVTTFMRELKVTTEMGSKFMYLAQKNNNSKELKISQANSYRRVFLVLQNERGRLPVTTHLS